MANAAERTVRVASIFYRGADDRYRRGSAGDSVSIHPEDVSRFDEFNRLAGDPVAEPAREPAEPKKPAAARRKATD